ncbi:MAG: NADPH:quinone oxidoreductase family protein [Deltaproteobacteria bacterium]|nr:NADPH:quinone oxidoreductase family protein [Deltaproteobacteria bacterium]
MLPVGRKVVVSSIAPDPLAAIEQASLVAMPAPDPAQLSPRDVIIAIASASVGWVDLLMMSGQYQHAAKPPYTPGLEYAGTIAWAGADAAIAVGERVLVDPFLAGPRSLGSYQGSGGFATYAVAPIEAVHRIPGALTFDEACNLLGNYETAYHCLVTRGRVQAGETVLVHGASGSVGLAAVHIAKLLGATVIATGRSRAKLELVAAQGADHIVTTDTPLRDSIKALTGGRGVDVVYDGVGGDLSVESLRCVRFGARYLIVGWAATPFVTRTQANVLPTNLIMMKGLDVLGCPTAISTAHDPSSRAPRLEQILAWAGAGKIHPLVSRRYALTEFADALRAKWHGETVGGIVLHPAG